VIKYALVCAFDHPFEGWFSTSADWDSQRARGLVECPVCGTREVAKQIMAPAVSGTKAQGAPGSGSADRRTMVMEAMGRMRRHVLDTFEDVGDQFATEARAIHDGDADDRGIYGEATPKEVRDLIQDGVQVAPLPPEPPKKNDVN
jgi:hypothetical protein